MLYVIVYKIINKCFGLKDYDFENKGMNIQYKTKPFVTLYRQEGCL